jgi:hypothetical protein
VRLVSKITRAKRAGSMVQEKKCLPGKHKALSSNPSTMRKNKIKSDLKEPIKIEVSVYNKYNK